MTLFDKVKDTLAFWAAKDQIADDPILRAALARSSVVYNSLPLKDHISEKTSNNLSTQIVEHIYGIICAEKPILKCREELAVAVLEYAKYQVLVLPPEPEDDPTGLRGTQGITGELMPQLLEIAEKNKDIRELMYGIVDKPTYNDVWDAVLFNYWKNYWFMATYDACRLALDDCNHVDDKDWLKPFIHAMCVWQEYCYRQDLGMPSAISGNDLSLTEIEYSTFLNTVMSDAQYPNLEWKEYYKDSINNGSLCPPF